MYAHNPSKNPIWVAPCAFAPLVGCSSPYLGLSPPPSFLVGSFWASLSLTVCPFWVALTYLPCYHGFSIALPAPSFLLSVASPAVCSKFIINFAPRSLCLLFIHVK